MESDLECVEQVLRDEQDERGADAVRKAREELDRLKLDVEGLRGHRDGLYKVFHALAADDRARLATVDETIQQDVDAIVDLRVDLAAAREAVDALDRGIAPGLLTDGQNDLLDNVRAAVGGRLPNDESVYLRRVNEQTAALKAALASMTDEKDAARGRFEAYCIQLASVRKALLAECVGCREGWPVSETDQGWHELKLTEATGRRVVCPFPPRLRAVVNATRISGQDGPPARGVEEVVEKLAATLVEHGVSVSDEIKRQWASVVRGTAT